MRMFGGAAYLRRLRERQKISRAKLAATVSTTENTIWRVETNLQEPGGVMLLDIVHALGGNWQDLYELVHNKASNEEGIARADAWLVQSAHLREQGLSAAPSSDQLAVLIESLRAEQAGSNTNPAMERLLEAMRWLVVGWRTREQG
ncbi:MAG: hypothetical protein OHK0022_16340 [Roseiflexaceae bacterium]